MREEKRKKAEEAGGSPKKVPHLVLPAAAAAAAEAGPACGAAASLGLADSTSTGHAAKVNIDDTGTEENTSTRREHPTGGARAEETADIQARQLDAAPPLQSSSRQTPSVWGDEVDGIPCEHMFVNIEDAEYIMALINSSGFPQLCGHSFNKKKIVGCCKEGVDLMVCAGCEMPFCSEGGARHNPKGHARQHASRSGHLIAFWHDNPLTGYCFHCERYQNLGGDIAEYEEYERALFGDSRTDDWRTVVRHGDKPVSAETTEGRYVVKGLLNLGNTCYMNALVQCLHELGKLRTMVLGLDTPPGTLGVHLKDLFVEMSSASTCTLMPQNMLNHIQMLFPKFTPNQMHDSHELLKHLCDALDREAKQLNRHSIIDSIFRGQLCDTIQCNRCSSTSVTRTTFDDLAVPLPSKNPPAKGCSSTSVTRTTFDDLAVPLPSKNPPAKGCSSTSVTRTTFDDLAVPLPSKNPPAKGCSSTSVIRASFDYLAVPPLPNYPPAKCTIPLSTRHMNILPTIDESIAVPVTTIPGVGSSQIPCSQFEVVALEKAPKPMQVGPGDIGRAPLASIKAKEKTHTIKVTTEDKGKAQDSHKITTEDMEHVKSIGSIEECLSLLFEKHAVEWNCVNCSKFAELPSINSIKDRGQKMASTNINTTADGDQTEQLDRKICQVEHSSNLNRLTEEGPSSSRQPHYSDSQHQSTKGINLGVKYPASCSTANQIPECQEGVQQAVPISLLTDEHANLSTSLDIQDASRQNQGSEKQATMNDHTGHQLQENQNDLPIQTHFISKLPPVLAIQLKRYSSGLSKLEGHVSFKEVLDVGPFLDPSSEEKDNSRYLLVGIVEHVGSSLRVGHYVAYVRGGPRPQSGESSSSWFRVSDTVIKQVSVEDVVRCSAYLLFYERMMMDEVPMD